MRLVRIALIAVAGAAGTMALDALAASASSQLRVLTAQQVREEVRRTGLVRGPARVDDDIDLALLKTAEEQAGRLIEFHDVSFRGRLSGVPGGAMRFVRGSVCILGSSGGETWKSAVELWGVGIGRLERRRGVHAGNFSCIDCKVCSASFENARFDGEATFTGTTFGDEPPRDICGRSSPAKCSNVNFGGATFVGIARFDHANFAARTSFHGAVFNKEARFSGLTATLPLSFVGMRAKDRVEFRGCRLSDVRFGQDAGRASSYEATEFGAQADFRGCQFMGASIFDQVVFKGEALFTRAVVAGAEFSFRGAHASRSIDLTGARLPEGGRLALDAMAADSVRLDWASVGPMVLRGLEGLEPSERAPALEALSRRLDSLGAPAQARLVRFEAQRENRAQRKTWCEGRSGGACLAGEAEWWLWTLPTRNGTDPSMITAALALLWGVAAALAATVGKIAVLPRAALADAGPVYAPVLVEEIPRDARWPEGAARLREAAGFANALVLKLGAKRARMAAPNMSVALWVIWAASWGLLAGFAAVLAASFPGLRLLSAG